MATQMTKWRRMVREYMGACGASVEYSDAFVRALGGEDAWSREARVVLALADAHGMTIAEGPLSMSDVRDLQALEAALAWHSQSHTHHAAA